MRLKQLQLSHGVTSLCQYLIMREPHESSNKIPLPLGEGDCAASRVRVYRALNLEP